MIRRALSGSPANTGSSAKREVVPQPEAVTVVRRVPLRHLRQHRGNQPVGARKVVVLEQRVVDRSGQIAAGEIVRLRRVERLDPAAAGGVQYPQRLSSRRRGRDRNCEKKRR
ncbi:MAG: hypothetical protein L6W00_15325 [Lentisphaeria bacterium]|nr:MAG: hypothetical protein L6W00_15325 [Lentisphaeria bacterium]